MMFQRSFFSMTFCLISFFGCSSPKNTTAAPVFTDQPNGKYQAEKELPADDSSHYTFGCKTKGQAEHILQIDPRLKAGMVFNYSVQVSSTISPSTSIIMQAQVLSVDLQNLVANLTVQASAGIPGVNPGMTSKKSCLLSPDGFLRCTYEPNLPTAQFQLPDCKIIDGKFHAHPKSVGKFTTTSGQTVNAFKFVHDANGTVVCNNKNMGTGSIVITSVHSNEVPTATVANQCGGVQIFSSYTVKKTDGSVIYATRYEHNSVR